MYPPWYPHSDLVGPGNNVSRERHHYHVSSVASRIIYLWTEKFRLDLDPSHPPKMNFTGHEHLRTRLVLSLLSGKSLKVTGIRSQDKDPGLRGSFTLHLKKLATTNEITAFPL